MKSEERVESRQRLRFIINQYQRTGIMLDEDVVYQLAQVIALGRTQNCMQVGTPREVVLVLVWRTRHTMDAEVANVRAVAHVFVNLEAKRHVHLEADEVAGTSVRVGMRGSRVADGNDRNHIFEGLATFAVVREMYLYLLHRLT